MLIRLCGHYPNNPNHIDKLISIKGLPEEWFFRASRFGGRELVHPWEPDVEENIPKEIRHLCEPTEITKVFPPIEKGRENVVDKKTILGVRFDYMTEPGQQLWEKIERFLDRMTPRDQKIPAPVMVAPNQKSNFDPHEARRTVRGSLEFRKCEIPDIDFRASETTTGTATVAPQLVTLSIPVSVAKEAEKEPYFHCDPCNKDFDKKQGLVMHNMKKHGTIKAEPIGV